MITPPYEALFLKNHGIHEAGVVLSFKMRAESREPCAGFRDNEPTSCSAFPEELSILGKGPFHAIPY